MSAPARIVLVGLPGAGKSSVGPLVAQRLGWRFVDLDEDIVRAAGRSIAEIFAAEGESGFRERERAATAALAGQGGLVIAPGGGWMMDPGNRAALGEGTMLVHLRVSPGVAVARLGSAISSRPLLKGSDPVSAIAALAAAREGTYLQANHTVSVDSLTPDAVASIIVALAAGGDGGLG